MNLANIKQVTNLLAPEKKRAELIEHAKKIKVKIDDGVLDSVIKVGQIKGKYYCPCIVIENMKEEKRDDFICPCKQHLKAIETKGKCHCGLYFK